MIELKSLPDLGRDLERTRAAMEGSMAGAAPYVKEEISALLSRNGKMIRAALVLLASRFGRAEAGKAEGMAASVELLHLATLVHDDVIDGAGTRRGLPTLSSLRGSRQAVLIGDYILTRALALAVDNVPDGDPGALARLLGRICEGEIEQGSQRFSVDISQRGYLRRINGKTATLFRASMRLAATEAGCGAEAIQALTRFGHCLGMAFQIVDDILDITASEAELGKPSGSDVKEGVFTLPVIIALRESGQRLAACLKKPPYSRLRIRKILRLVRDSGGLAGAKRAAEGYIRLALRELERLPDISARAALRELAGIVLTRKS